MKPCPLCGGEMHKVIYMGLPGQMCFDTCNCLTGIASYAPPVESQTDDGPMFAFMVYEGSYWRALFNWLFRSSSSA